MASRVVMPKLTDTMTEGALLKWYKKEGDQVESGDVLAEIETDKAIMDLEAFSSGVLKKIFIAEGTTVPAGNLLAIIAGKDEEILEEEINKPEPARSDKMTAEAMAQKTLEQIPPEKETGELIIKASPLAKNIAKERGIDLSKIKGSGPGGRITERDLKGITAPKTEKGDETIEFVERKPFSIMRKAIIRSMTQSKIPVPHFYLASEIDMEKISIFQREWTELENGYKITITDILIKASALALKKVPQVNASFQEDHLEYHKEAHIGIAVGLTDGIITPVIKHCELKSLGQIAQETKPLIERARERRLSPEEYTGATFSISNLGPYDVDHFIAIITPPEAAVLAVGSIREVPIVRDCNILIGKKMQVTLSCDHRVIDGIGGATFLQELKKVIEHPSLLILK
jgi:pyruvate dehydrogenase E2 component (dihydrolipoyllysine-residue acetyltransferase)